MRLQAEAWRIHEGRFCAANGNSNEIGLSQSHPLLLLRSMPFLRRAHHSSDTSVRDEDGQPHPLVDLVGVRGELYVRV